MHMKQQRRIFIKWQTTTNNNMNVVKNKFIFNNINISKIDRIGSHEKNVAHRSRNISTHLPLPLKREELSEAGIQ